MSRVTQPNDLNSAALVRARVHPALTGLDGAGIVICALRFDASAILSGETFPHNSNISRKEKTSDERTFSPQAEAIMSFQASKQQASDVFLNFAGTC